MTKTSRWNKSRVLELARFRCGYDVDLEPWYSRTKAASEEFCNLMGSEEVEVEVTYTASEAETDVFTQELVNRGVFDNLRAFAPAILNTHTDETEYRNYAGFLHAKDMCPLDKLLKVNTQGNREAMVAGSVGKIKTSKFIAKQTTEVDRDFPPHMAREIKSNINFFNERTALVRSGSEDKDKVKYRVVLSSKPEDILKLGMVGPDKNACFRPSSQSQTAPLAIAQTPGCFILFIFSSKEPWRPIGRAWGHATDRGIMVTNVYPKDGSAKQEACKGIIKNAMDKLGYPSVRTAGVRSAVDRERTTDIPYIDGTTRNKRPAYVYSNGDAKFYTTTKRPGELCGGYAKTINNTGIPYDKRTVTFFNAETGKNEENPGTSGCLSVFGGQLYHASNLHNYRTFGCFVNPAAMQDWENKKDSIHVSSPLLIKMHRTDKTEFRPAYQGAGTDYMEKFVEISPGVGVYWEDLEKDETGFGFALKKS